MIENLGLRIFLAVLFSATIGLERQAYIGQINRKNGTEAGTLGVRTYALIGVLGTISGLVMSKTPLLSIFIGVGFLALIIGYYYFEAKAKEGNHGLTSELNLIWCFTMANIIGGDFIPLKMVVALVVGVLFILSLKKKIHKFVDNIAWSHVQQLILFGIIALVILPFLPDRAFMIKDISYLSYFAKVFGFSFGELSELEIFNPYGVWRVVVLITGVEIVAFGLQQLFGKKGGWMIASGLGGFISSTSTTLSIATDYKKNKNLYPALAGIIIANIASFIQILLIVIASNPSIIKEVFMLMSGLILPGIVLVFYFLSKSVEKLDTKEEGDKEIFSIAPAIKFAIIFSVVKVVTKVAYVLLGSSGFVIGSMIGGVTGMDAVAINTSQLVGDTITVSLAMFTLIAANSANLIAKVFYVTAQGDKKLGINLAGSFAIMTVGMLVSYFIFI